MMRLMQGNFSLLSGEICQTRARSVMCGNAQNDPTEVSRGHSSQRKKNRAGKRRKSGWAHPDEGLNIKSKETTHSNARNMKKPDTGRISSWDENGNRTLNENLMERVLDREKYATSLEAGSSK